jgi:hypothetical protein
MSFIKGKFLQFLVLFSFSAAAIFIFSCSDSTSPETEQGQLKVTMVDSPAGYDEVNIVVTRVEVHRSGSDSTNGWFVINNNTATYDLLRLRNGASVVLGNNYLDAGSYSQIRLIIGSGSNIVVDGITYPLEIPSGQQTGIKLNHAFVIESSLLYELILDFDAEHSIIHNGNGLYKLKPVIKVVPMIISGTISGKINPINAAGYVYAISGSDTSVTIAEPITGSFKLMALTQRIYRVEIFSANAAYNDTTITNVNVVAMQNTDLGTINLSNK